MSAKTSDLPPMDTVFLGSGSDDGVALPFESHYNFSYVDVAVTLLRLLHDLAVVDLRPTHVVSFDDESRPLALAVAAETAAIVEEVEHAAAGQLILLVKADVAFPQEMQGFQEAMTAAGARVVLFALHASYVPWQSPFYPDVVGVASPQATFPWLRRGRGRASSRRTDARDDAAVAQELRQALAAARATPYAEQLTKHESSVRRELEALAARLRA